MFSKVSVEYIASFFGAEISYMPRATNILYTSQVLVIGVHTKGVG
jgi:hypothetical protein